jgi:hypothetical protein
MGTTDSLDNMIAATVNNGNYPIFWAAQGPSSTQAALTTCGGVTGVRYPQVIPLPTVTSPCIGAVCSSASIAAVTINTTVVVGIIYTLGTLTVSGNSYSDGVAAPTKTIKGTAVTAAFSHVYAAVTTSLGGATTPTLTFNYTNQSGTTGRSGTITTGTNPVVGTTWDLMPHLQSGDTAIQNFSASGPNGLSISTGTSGVITVYGVLPVAIGVCGPTYSPSTPAPMTICTPQYVIESGESLGVFRWGSNTQTPIFMTLNLAPVIA